MGSRLYLWGFGQEARALKPRSTTSMARFSTVAIAAASLAISGCMASSIREMQLKYDNRPYELEMSLADINRAFHRWSKECSPHPGLEIDPEDSTQARLVWPYASLMSFKEAPAGHTHVDTFCYAGFSCSIISEAIAVIKGSNDCDLEPLGSGKNTGGGGVVIVAPIIIQ
jgi:hypothetical protein